MTPTSGAAFKFAAYQKQKEMENTFLKTARGLAHGLTVFVILLVPAIAGAQETNEYVGAKLTDARAVSLLLLGVSIASVVTAVWSKKRPEGKSKKRTIILAGVLGLIAVIISAIRIAATTGFGTGGGKAGAIIAFLTGIIGIGLAMKILLQTRNSNNPD